MDDLTDADLLAKWCAGDRDAFAVLVSRHYGLVQTACRRQAASGEVDDCTQAVFLVLARRPAAAGRAPVLAAWLQRTAWFVCKHARRAAQRRRQVEQTAAPATDDHGATPPEALDHLDDCLLKLPEKQRAAVTLHYLTGKSAEEVAATLKTSRDNAYLLISRGLAGLRVLLARRGVAGAGLVSVLAAQAQAATASAPTAILACLSGAPTAGAATLATGAMTAMTIATLTPVAAAAGLLLTLGATTVLLTAEPTPVAPVQPPPVTQPAPTPATAPPAVVRAAAGDVKDLSGTWNDIDAKYSSEDLGAQILKDPWLANFIQTKQRNPKLMVGKVVVRANGEILNTGPLLDKVQRLLLASGKIVVIDPAPSSDKTALPEQGEKTGTPPASEVDVVLNGSINVERSAEGSSSVKIYTVTLTGTDPATRQMRFSVETRIRKEIQQSRWR